MKLRSHHKRLYSMLFLYKGRLFAGARRHAGTAITEPALAAMMKPLLDGGFLQHAEGLAVAWCRYFWSASFCCAGLDFPPPHT